MKEGKSENKLKQERERSCVRKMEPKGVRKGEHIRKSQYAEKTVGPCETVREQGV